MPIKRASNQNLLFTTLNISKIIFMNYIKYILLATVFVFTCGLMNAQNTTSPYSIYGLGDLNSNLTGKNHALGGTGYARMSDGYLNNLNPASLRGVDSLEFLMEIGTSFQYADYQSQGSTRMGGDWNFNYLAFGFRMKPWWHASFGMAPYSNVGYTIQEQFPVQGGNETYTSVFKGEGGVNNVYLSQSFSLSNRLSVGLNTNFLFGSILQTEDIQAQSFVSAVQVENKNYFANFTFDMGLQYDFIKRKNYAATLGIVYSPERELKTEKVQNIYDGNGQSIFADSSSQNDYSLPHTLGVGLSFNKFNKFNASVDYTFQNWEATNYYKNKARLVNSHRAAMGVEFIPDAFTPKNTWEATSYRFGVFYQKNYLSIKNESLNSYGFSVGMGIPMKKNRSCFHVAYEFERRGTLNKGLIQENIHNVSLNISLNDIWFFKKKYD